jgi:hypothetical protein
MGLESGDLEPPRDAEMGSFEQMFGFRRGILHEAVELVKSQVLRFQGNRIWLDQGIMASDEVIPNDEQRSVSYRQPGIATASTRGGASSPKAGSSQRHALVRLPWLRFCAP